MIFKNSTYENLKEFLFFKLVSIMYKDALKIKTTKKIGEEDSNLTAAFIAYHTTPLKRYYDIDKKSNLFKKKMPLFNHDLDKLIQAMGNDGATIIKDAHVTASGVFFDGIVRKCKRKTNETSFEDIAARFLPAGTTKIGNRIRVALAVALTGKKNGSVLAMSQTVQTNTGTGKILEFGINGIKRMFYLEKKRGIKGILIDYEYDKKKKKIILKKRKVIHKK